ncbi:MAG: Crp/Fnr family transcriptional regulator [Methylococcales bacterium]|nr:Crp/Fnr family transcriptional regulator [Methylococcaceae bacterium]
MSPNQAVPATNLLLNSLPHEDCEQLLAHCEHIELEFTEVLYRAGEPISHVYFPTGSFISLIAPINGSAGLEVGLVGNEGILGITLMLGVDIAPFQALVQGAGPALRITAKLFLQTLQQSAALKKALKRYLYVSMSQLAQTAACTRFHVVEARLARWLLMTQDRAHSENFHVTHVFLAYILGVRRVGITKAAHSLQKQKLISYQRGNITIINRTGLEAASCGCYRADKAIYSRILG